MTSIPFVDLAAQQQRIGASIRQRIDVVLDHGQFINGPEIVELEAALAVRSGVPHVVACASGTDALLMVLMTLGVGPGDAVLVPAFTFVATAEAVVLAGATPVFCDVRTDTFNLDPDQIGRGEAAARAAGLRPVGVIPVDLFGQPAEYSRLAAEAEAYGLWVFADAAQSLGGSVDGRAVGALADLTATSFFPAKPLGCYGDGGAIFVTDESIAGALRSIREHGRGAHRYETVRVGLTGRLDTIQAAVLLAKLEVFDDEIERRQQVATRYDEGLADRAVVPFVLPDFRSAWAQYTIRVADRDGVASALAADGVPTAVYYPKPLHRQPPYVDCPRADPALVRSEMLGGEVLSLPMHPYLEAAVQDRIIGATIRAIGATS